MSKVNTQEMPLCIPWDNPSIWKGWLNFETLIVSWEDYAYTEHWVSLGPIPPVAKLIAIELERSLK